MSKTRVHLYIEGYVQGVGYRASALHKARSLGLTGWVRNLRDGRVEAVAEGEEEAIAQFIKWCQKGPPGSVVERVNVQNEKYTGEFKQFDITF
jgi:acylphosphatase